MTRLLRSAWVIARRDYTATVLSRTFLFFLLGPLLPLLIGGLFGAIVTSGDDTPASSPILVAGPPAAVHAIIDARGRLATRLGADWMPPLRVDTGAADPAATMLLGGLDHPVLTGTADDVARLRGPVTLLLEEARGPTRSSPHLAFRAIAPPAKASDDGGREFARGAQAGLFLLTMILAGMLISNMVEEKSSKVIEVLAAAVPIDAIFAGKLVGMLAVSLTGIAAWGTMAVAALAFVPHAGLPAPAVGWAAFVLLAIVYFSTVYLLIGALYLGIGAQAGSVREVQTISLPLTMLQLLFFGLASTTPAKPEGILAIVAAIVPWSSPFAMLARAVVQPALWPHALALAWQLVCLALIVRVGARLFRRNVLRSGPKVRL
ncbi:ABC transporter permease [Sphingomonas nostoxanthinifaciens]|uniref:ABC transporter permease n=1 Tax=Sphingomonas nostoxanthinifaciens TaxID=2872652 RepID=UPI001CC218BA|nr:ABC transporter permease [Sphingomonas nostoxanthinifaciens]UAK25422.1 ABC transporter permease [Sphingomonas nostoxanthinifaciens]